MSRNFYFSLMNGPIHHYLKRIPIAVTAILLYSFSFSQVTQTGAIGITVKDMNRSLKFYTEAIGFKKIYNFQKPL